MAVTITPVPTVIAYAAGAIAQTDFPVPFPFDDAADLQVLVDGDPVAFTIAIGAQDSGIVTSATAVLTVPVANAAVLIYRDMALSQEAVFALTGSLSTATLNREVSRLWMAAQDVDSRADNAISRPPEDRGMAPLVLPASAERVNRYLAFDSLGNPVAQSLTTLPVAISAGWIDPTAIPFAAVGNNIADDTAALQAALATGRSLYLPAGKTFKVTGSLTLAFNGQKVFGDGPFQSTLRPVGNFHVFNLTAYESTGVHNLRVDASGMAGGYVLNTSGANRVDCRHLRVDSPYGVIQVHWCNAGTFDDIYVQSPRTPFAAIYCYGTFAQRSDVLRFVDVNIGGPDTCLWDGMVIDGSVFTVELLRCTWVNYRHGLVMQNTVSTFPPQFICATDIQFDYGSAETLLFTAGTEVWINQLYAQGAGYYPLPAHSLDKPAIYIGPAVNGVKIGQSFISGSSGAGVVIEGQDIFFSDSQILLPGFSTGLFQQDCVRITGSAKRIHFKGGEYGGRAGVGAVCRYAFTVAAGAETVSIVGAETYGCMLGPLLDLTTLAPGNVVMHATQQAGYYVNDLMNGWEVGPRDGSGATATPVVAAGIITSIGVTNGGRRYRTPPTVLFFDPASTGSGAVATAVLTNGVVTSISVGAGGTAYSAQTKVELRSAGQVPTLQASWPGQPDIAAQMLADGAGAAVLGNGRGTGMQALAVDVASVNFLQMRGRALANTPDIIAGGPGTNINIGITPKGTGRLELGGPLEPTAGAVAQYLVVRIAGVDRKIPLHSI